jgi:formylglycine-generating enzyme required for sulfatase activity
MRHVTRLIAIVISALAAFQPGPASAEKRVALVIGNAGYSHIAGLPNVPNDAAAMAALLRAAKFDSVDVRANLGVAELRRALREFSGGAAGADVAVLFYAGHGIEVGQTNYLIPVDARLATDYDVEDEAVALERVLQAMEPARRLRLVILDACRENPFVKSMKRTSATRSVGRGLARVEPQASNTLIAYATKASAVAEDGKGPNSPYTTALIKHLIVPGLDLRFALGRVRDEVLAATANKQEPYHTGSLGGGVVSLFAGAAIEVPATPQPPAKDAEREWAAVDKTSREELDLFIRRHPGSPLVEYARARRTVLVCRDERALQAKAVERTDAVVLHGLAGNAECASVREEARAHLCREERAEVDRLSAVGDREALQRTAAMAWCTEVRSVAGRRLCEVEEAEADRRAKNWDRDGLKRLAIGATCASARQRAEAAEHNLPACTGTMVTLADDGTRCVNPGQAFRDCPDCPEMVVVPAGEFMMGSPAHEQGRVSHEGPQRRVTIAKPFAVGKFEATFAEWDACVAAGVCRHSPDDRGWGRGRRPVINVSWNDIVGAYLPWLSLRTRKTYRLLSEAEWEYTARAGTTTPFSTGSTIATSQANFDGTGIRRLKSVDVGSFQPNAFGLHDMHGNAWEWVQDCWKETYQGAPSSGSAWTTGNCNNGRGLRGGSWISGPVVVRSAFRSRGSPDIRTYDYGFRVATTLAP